MARVQRRAVIVAAGTPGSRLAEALRCAGGIPAVEHRVVHVAVDGDHAGRHSASGGWTTNPKVSGLRSSTTAAASLQPSASRCWTSLHRGSDQVVVLVGYLCSSGVRRWLLHDHTADAVCRVVNRIPSAVGVLVPVNTRGCDRRVQYRTLVQGLTNSDASPEAAVEAAPTAMVGLIVRVVVLVLPVGLVVLGWPTTIDAGPTKPDATFQPRPPDDEPEASGCPRFFQGVCPTRKGRPARDCDRAALGEVVVARAPRVRSRRCGSDRGFRAGSSSICRRRSFRSGLHHRSHGPRRRRPGTESGKVWSAAFLRLASRS